MYNYFASRPKLVLEYDSPEAMPPDVRRLYAQALEKARAEARRTGEELPRPRPAEPAPEGSLSGRTLTIILILLAAAALLFISR